jgi:hypothetical protein
MTLTVGLQCSSHAARHELKRSQQETATAARVRDDLIAQRDTARTHAAGTPDSDGLSGLAPVANASHP